MVVGVCVCLYMYVIIDNISLLCLLRSTQQ